MEKSKGFASGTSVTVEKSRAELESLLEKHGATEFAIFKDKTFTRVVFRMKGRMVRHEVMLPRIAQSYESGAMPNLLLLGSGS